MLINALSTNKQLGQYSHVVLKGKLIQMDNKSNAFIWNLRQKTIFTKNLPIVRNARRSNSLYSIWCHLFKATSGIGFSSVALSSKWVFFSLKFPPEHFTHLSYLPCVLLFPPISTVLISFTLITFIGESNGKLPPRTCPECSVPEPYRSHDWALVPAKPGFQGWILMNEWMNDSYILV